MQNILSWMLALCLVHVCTIYTAAQPQESIAVSAPVNAPLRALQFTLKQISMDRRLSAVQKRDISSELIRKHRIQFPEETYSQNTLFADVNSAEERSETFVQEQDQSAGTSERTSALVRKYELIADMHLSRESQGKIPKEKSRQIDQYIGDPTIPASDRYEISFLAKNVREDRTRIHSRSDAVNIRIRHARELIQEFPNEPRGFGYLLSIAKGESGRSGPELAREIIKSETAPEQYKEGARRVLAQRALLGTRLKIEGVDLARYLGNPLVIYTWTLKQPDVFSLLKVWSQVQGVQFLGINLDAETDTDKAKMLAQTQTLPGELIYEGDSKDNPLSKQLCFLSQSETYIIDHQGKLVDFDGLFDTLEKLRALAKQAHIGAEVAK